MNGPIGSLLAPLKTKVEPAAAVNTVLGRSLRAVPDRFMGYLHGQIHQVVVLAGVVRAALSSS